MKRAGVAAAVCAVLSSPVWAQSSVTLYGVADVGLSRDSGVPVAGTTNKKNRLGVDSGIQSNSRFGLRGTEDLGNGLKATFVFETGLNLDQGGLNNNGATGGAGFGRETTVGLAGGFGAFKVGRQLSSQYILLTAADPFGAGMAGRYNNFAQVDTRFNNYLLYSTPSFGGFTGTFGYAANGLTDEVLNGLPAGANSRNTRVVEGGGTYANGPLLAGFDWHSVRNGTNPPAAGGATSRSHLSVAAKYNFGPVALHGFVTRTRNDAWVSGAKATDWMLGVSVPVSKGTLLASYVRRDENQLAGDQDANQWALGYTYPLSKRTNLYTAVARINNRNAAKTAYDNGVSGYYSVGNNTASGLGNQQINLGLRHTF